MLYQRGLAFPSIDQGPDSSLACPLAGNLKWGAAQTHSSSSEEHRDKVSGSFSFVCSRDTGGRTLSHNTRVRAPATLRLLSPVPNEEFSYHVLPFAHHFSIFHTSNLSLFRPRLFDKSPLLQKSLWPWWKHVGPLRLWPVLKVETLARCVPVNTVE